jgi:hypothetical protein
MIRLSTIGLAALLAVAPGFSGDSPAQPGPSKTAPILASTLITVADDFIVDVYHNGVKLPDDRRELVADVYGATVERIKVDVRLGDWLVFNVVNNRMRWSGSSYFAVKGQGNAGFRTELDLGRWSCCDDPGEVGRFIAERGHFADHRALPIAKPWWEGDSLMERHADGWKGQAIWGGSRNTWIKFIAF